jgi:hypothetical protein
MPKNILLCYHTIGGTSYYHDFAEEFLAKGNKTMHWNFCGTDFSAKNRDLILERIAEFKPDIIFSYNNICPEEVIKLTQVPVMILDADNPEFFHNKHIINKYNQLFYLGYQSNSKDLYKNILGANITDKNYLFSPTATNFKSDTSIKPRINISFIGSNFYRNFLEDRIITQEERDSILATAKEIRKNYYFQDNSIDTNLINCTKYFLAGQERLKYLSMLIDLGLEIYSNTDWKELFTYDLELVNCYNKKIIITKQENQDLYNSSKVSINLSHLQAVNSYSWRVPDIMATNSCLVMENKVDWHMTFGNHISDAVKKLIIYSDQYDMRNKCIKLLQDEDLRLRCVEECQSAIEKNGRWSTRIKNIESFLGMNFDYTNESNFDSLTEVSETISYINSRLEEDRANEEAVKKEGDTQKECTDTQIKDLIEDKILLNLEKKKFKSDAALSLRALVVAIYFIPFIGKFIVKERKVQKIILNIFDKINQYKIFKKLQK